MNKHALLDCWTMFHREHDNISIDRMICDPDLRAAFLESAKSVVTAPEKEILWSLMTLRKGKQLSKSSKNRAVQ